jgi:predicted metal-binding protein
LPDITGAARQGFDDDDLIVCNTCKDREVHVTSNENQEGSHMGDSKIDRRIENKIY